METIEDVRNQVQAQVEDAVALASNPLLSGSMARLGRAFGEVAD